MRKARRTDTVDVVLTRNSGRLGVLFWINAYLDRAGVPSVTEDHPEARALIDWVIAEYETGVVDPIPVEELEQRALVLLDESPVQT